MNRAVAELDAAIISDGGTLAQDHGRATALRAVQHIEAESVALLEIVRLSYG